jgi:hypothetical protein
MIQFGDANCPQSICTGTSVENVTLDGNNAAVVGILNNYSQTNTYVNHVTLYRVLGTGLQIGTNAPGSAQNSGPYSNIDYDTGSSGVSGSVCAQIDVSGTKGFYGLTCRSTPESQAAVLLDSSNNTLQDVRIAGFFDGILVGSQAPASSDVLLNILGDTMGNILAPPNVIHISNTNTNTVTDIAILGVSNAVMGTYTIRDDVTGTTLVSSSQSDSYEAMYVLGETKYGGYSRYATSPNVNTWSFGNSAPNTSTNCPIGSLYSCIGSACNSTAALWGCSGSISGGKWAQIK